MNAVEVLNKIKGVLGIELSEEKTDDVKLTQEKLDNGTIIEAEEFAADKEVFIISEDSEDKIPLPVGDYTMESGQILSVKEEGIIAEIKDAEEKEEEEKDEEEIEASDEKAEQKEEALEEAPAYATAQDLSELKSLVEEIKAMAEKNREELSAQSKEELKKEELAEVPVNISHNPEADSKKDLSFFKPRGATQTTYDRVLANMAKFNN